MNLKKVTLLTVIAILYNFVYRVVATVFPALFNGVVTVGIIVTMSLLAALVILLFFVYFYRTFTENSRLKRAAIFGIVASSGLILMKIKTLLSIFGDFQYMLPVMYIEQIIFMASSILILLFFVMLYKEIQHTQKISLKKAVLLALIGSIVSIFLLVMTIVNYLNNGALMLFAGSSWVVMVILIGLYSFGFFTSFYFFTTFYRLQEQNSNPVIALCDY